MTELHMHSFCFLITDINCRSVHFAPGMQWT